MNSEYSHRKFTLHASPLTLLLSVLFFTSCGEHEISQGRHANGYTPSLFLLSKGLVTDTLKAEFLDFLGQEPGDEKVAVIANASSTQKKMIKKTRKVKQRFASMGFDSTRVEMFDILVREPTELHDYDIIYILGGNPYKLLEEVRSTGTDSVLVQLAQEDGKILMGYSAGSLLLGPSLELLNSCDSLLEFNDRNMTELTCLGLYDDFHIFPHYDDFCSQVPELRGMIDRWEEETGEDVVRLNDGQAVIVKDGKREVVGTILEPENN